MQLLIRIQYQILLAAKKSTIPLINNIVSAEKNRPMVPAQKIKIGIRTISNRI
tara:strand:+ start:189 stop:347 length:159 start_codon:yes stop_codon:yes gene_type:complete